MSFDFMGRYLARDYAKVVEGICCAEVGSVVSQSEWECRQGGIRA
jgi:hypothetical protein